MSIFGFWIEKGGGGGLGGASVSFLSFPFFFFPDSLLPYFFLSLVPVTISVGALDR
jgi:hypothetical protein